MVKQEDFRSIFVGIYLANTIGHHQSTSWEIDGETVERVSDFIFWGTPKSLQMVTAAMKLKDAYSLEEKL